MDFIEFEREWDSEAPFFIAHTSGSTGVPKSVEIPKAFARKSAEATNRFFGIDATSLLHSCVAADFIGGKMMLVRSKVADCRFSSEIPSNRPLRGLGPDVHISLLAVVPSQMIDILERLDHGLLPKIDNIIIGGSAIPSSLRMAIGEYPLTCYESYGMTETASHIALRRVVADNDPGLFEIIDERVSVELDDRGCLTIRYADGLTVITNDMASVEDRRHFSILGRADDVIVSGGKKVHPQEVERILEDGLNCRFAISWIPDEKWGQMVVAAIEAPSGGTLPAEFAEALSRLPSWQRPKKIFLVDYFPLTANGKLSRPRLAELLKETLPSDR